MLDSTKLSEYITDAVRTLLCPAIKEALLRSYPTKSDIGDQIAEKFANNIDDMISDQFGTSLACAIDYYIKNGEIYGPINAVGPNGVSQAIISPTKTPIANGALPNTLGMR